MPIYQYQILDDNNNPIDEYFEIFQSMKEDALTKEPDTGRKCQRCINIPNVLVDTKQPKTIGALAEKNTQDMIARNDPRIDTRSKEEKRPWWRKHKDKPIDTSNMTGKQIKKYIEKGET